MATSASAGGLSFSGGQISAGYGAFFDSAGLAFSYVPVTGSFAFDFDNSDWEIQVDGSASFFGAGASFNDAVVIAANQVNDDLKIGGYAGSYFAGGGFITEVGAVAMKQLGNGAYIDLDVGMIFTGGGGGNLAWAYARYDTGGLFADATIAGGTGIPLIASANIGYSLNVFGDAKLSGGVGALMGYGDIFPKAFVELSIPFGGANTPDDTDSRLFHRFNLVSNIGL